MPISEQERLVIVSTPRCGRTFLGYEIGKLGVSVIEDSISCDHSISFLHDFDLMLSTNCKVIRLYRDPIECLVSWFMLDVVSSRIEMSQKSWDDTSKPRMEYMRKFHLKYESVETIAFSEILSNQSAVIRKILSFIDGGNSIDVPSFRLHTPRDYSSFPLSIQNTLQLQLELLE